MVLDEEALPGGAGGLAVAVVLAEGSQAVDLGAGGVGVLAGLVVLVLAAPGLKGRELEGAPEAEGQVPGLGDVGHLAGKILIKI